MFLVSYSGYKGLYSLTLRSIFKDFGFLYHLVYLLVCLLGFFVHVFFYSLLLLDVVWSNDTLKNVIRCVTKNAKSVLLTALFAVILIYLFSICGYKFFRDDFLMDVDETTNVSNTNETSFCYSKDNCVSNHELEISESKERTCDSLLYCIITTLNHGLRNGGGIGDVLRVPSTSVSLK